jgi:Ca-activated chloride channel homolog
VLTALAVLSAGDSGAQPRLKSGIELVHVDVTVLDASGRIVTGLPRDAFEVFEDGRRQEIALFSDQSVPTSVAILIDRSPSMRDKRYEVALAALDALGSMLRPDDQWSIATFARSTSRAVRWTQPSAERPRSVPKKPWGEATRLFGAITDMVRDFRSRQTRKGAIVLITDGNDSGALDFPKEEDAARALRAGEILFYAIAIDWPSDVVIDRVNLDVLSRLSLPTGGAAFLAATPQELIDTARQIGAELHQQYTIGYVPPGPRDGKIHRIDVRTSDPGYRIRARTAYLAKR